MTSTSPFSLIVPFGGLPMEVHMGQVALTVVWSLQVAGRAWAR